MVVEWVGGPRHGAREEVPDRAELPPVVILHEAGGRSYRYELEVDGRARYVLHAVAEVRVTETRPGLFGTQP